MAGDMDDLTIVIEELKKVTRRLEKLETTEQRYFDLKHAGLYCGGKTAEAMRMLARRGRIPVIKQGKSLLMDKVDIDRAMAEQKLEIPE